ncbi:MAG: hypothetical protein ACYTBJ_25195 [Planctomycetota bacterium]
MKKFLLGFVIGAGCSAALFALIWKHRPPGKPTALPAPPSSAIVFDLNYRGLTADDDQLHYHSYWGFGHSDGEETPFIKALKRKTEHLRPVRNPHFKGAEWSAVELEDNSAVAFYFDLNADGELSDNEKMLPAEQSETDDRKVVEFVTPDFVMNTDAGRRAPYRVLLQASSDEPDSPPNCMWSPYCVLQGTSDIYGEPTKLILYDSGFSGSFNEFGRARFSLLTPAEENRSYVNKDTLSSLIYYRGKFYRLQLQGKHGEDGPMRVILQKDTSPRGSLTVKVASDGPLKSKLNHGSIKGLHDKTIHFGISGHEPQLPAAAYKLDSGWIHYGAKNDDDWRLSFYEGPEIKIEPEKNSTVELGRPALSVHAIDEKERYRNDPKEKTTFSKGTKIYITARIRGKAGERYGRFSKRKTDSRNYDDIKPTLTVADSEGKQVLSAQMEYG